SLPGRIREKRSDTSGQERERKLQHEIDALLAKGTVYEQHKQSLQKIYAEYPTDSVWHIYREKLASLLLSSDVGSIFEILSFWFDESFEMFGHEPYIAQTFFCKLPFVFETARREHQTMLRKTAQATAAYYTQLVTPKSPYSWYPAIQKLFESNG
ncbi:MAG: hypothetical protein WCD86_16410, partial [Ktedonobacteraceae bacterium]